MNKKKTTEGVVGEHGHGGFELPGGKYLAVIIIAAIVLGTIGYFATQTPVKTSQDASPEVKNPNVQPAENPAVNVGTTALVAVPITNLIPVPANVPPATTSISVNNPPKIMQFVTSSGIKTEIYVTNIVFTNSMFAADIENRYSEPQALQEISLELYPGTWGQTWVAAPYKLTSDGHIDTKEWLILPAGEKVRIETNFPGLKEEQKQLIKAAGLNLGQ